MRTLRVTVDEESRVELLEPLQLSDKHQALLTILEPEVTQPRPARLCKGEFRVPNDFDEPLPESNLRDFGSLWPVSRVP